MSRTPKPQNADLWYNTGMENYAHFAAVYDLFMDNVDYDSWSRYLIGKLKEAGIQEGLVCELGCGTGNMTSRLADAGYDMIGIDASAEMLAVAQEKESAKKTGLPEETSQSGRGADADGNIQRPDILYLQQDMRAFELYGTVRAIVSVCDSLNYITKEDELLQVFRLVNNYLDPGGLFLFDMSTAAHYEQIGSATIAENREEGSFIWENEYDAASGRNRYDLTLYLPEEATGLYRRCEETHIERAYSEEAIRALLEEAGLRFISAQEAYTDTDSSTLPARLFVVAQEQGKN